MAYMLRAEGRSRSDSRRTPRALPYGRSVEETDPHEKSREQRATEPDTSARPGRGHCERAADDQRQRDGCEQRVITRLSIHYVHVGTSDG